MRSLQYIPVRDVSALVGKELSFTICQGVKQNFKVVSISYNQESDLYQGAIEGGAVFSLSREKMEKVYENFTENDLQK